MNEKITREEFEAGLATHGFTAKEAKAVTLPCDDCGYDRCSGWRIGEIQVLSIFAKPQKRKPHNDTE